MFSIQFYVFGTDILKFKWEPLVAPPTRPPQLSLFQMMYMILIVILGRGQKKIHLIIFRVETTPYSITIKLKKKLSNNIFFKSKYLQFVYFFLSEFNNKMGDDLQRHFFSGGVFFFFFLMIFKYIIKKKKKLVITRKFKNIKI